MSRVYKGRSPDLCRVYASILSINYHSPCTTTIASSDWMTKRAEEQVPEDVRVEHAVLSLLLLSDRASTSLGVANTTANRIPKPEGLESAHSLRIIPARDAIWELSSASVPMRGERVDRFLDSLFTDWDSWIQSTDSRVDEGMYTSLKERIRSSLGSGAGISALAASRGEKLPSGITCSNWCAPDLDTLEKSDSNERIEEAWFHTLGGSSMGAVAVGYGLTKCEKVRQGEAISVTVYWIEAEGFNHRQAHD